MFIALSNAKTLAEERLLKIQNDFKLQINELKKKVKGQEELLNNKVNNDNIIMGEDNDSEQKSKDDTTKENSSVLKIAKALSSLSNSAASASVIKQAGVKNVTELYISLVKTQGNYATLDSYLLFNHLTIYLFNY